MVQGTASCEIEEGGEVVMEGNGVGLCEVNRYIDLPFAIDVQITYEHLALNESRDHPSRS